MVIILLLEIRGKLILAGGLRCWLAANQHRKPPAKINNNHCGRVFMLCPRNKTLHFLMYSHFY
jgi:hypothetical protein